MKKPAKKNKGVPLPQARDKIFTEPEMRLLDQITLEVTEAWKKDLRRMKDCYERSVEYMDNLDRFHGDVESKIDHLNNLLSKDGPIYNLEKMLEYINQMFGFMNELKRDWESINLRLEKIERGLKSQGKISDKKWWKFWNS